MDKGQLRFQGFGLVCIVVVYLLILAGGIVRSTGSGMGCPDWPRCFGRIIPPTKESELPPDYQETYKNHGYGSMKFNPVKTWIEYVNRLLGALTGIFVLGLFIFSFAYKKSDKSIVQLSGLILLLVIIEGIIGKYVVSTNLKPVMVSVHMWGSLIIIILLIFTIIKTKRERFSPEIISNPESLKSINLILIILTVLQVILGTQVRQEIDLISASMDYNDRGTWIEKLGTVFYFHRSFSILLFIAHLYFVYKVQKSFRGESTVALMSYLLISFLVLEILAGVAMNYLEIPAVAQPIHMLLGSLIIGVQFFILFVLNFIIEKKKSVKIVNA
jgi:cytochrome c oxidase assembly protein subunit 15